MKAEMKRDPMDPEANWPEVLVLGDALVDRQYWIRSLPQAGGEAGIRTQMLNPGGAGANAAIGLSYLALRTALCGSLGADSDGALLLAQLERAGVDRRWIQIGGTTGFTITFIDEHSERTMFSYRGAAAQPLLLDAGLTKALGHARLLLVSGYQLLERQQAQPVLEAMRLVHAGEGKVALDPTPMIGAVPKDLKEQALGLVDLLLPNRAELEALAGSADEEQALAHLLQAVPAIALKKGSAGSRLLLRAGFGSPKGSLIQGADHQLRPESVVKAVDTTGAGDAFNAGFIAAFLRDEDPLAWLKAGNALAARAIAGRGAVTYTQAKER